MIPAYVFLELPAGRITPAAEEEFFTSLRMRNGTYKTTSRSRFSDVDRELQQLASTGCLCADHILDIGVSSGVSTLELLAAFDSAGQHPRIVATDLMTEGQLVRVFPGCWVLADDSGYPLRHDCFRWTMQPWVVRSDYRTGFFLVRKAVNLLFTWRARRLLRRGDVRRVARVALVTPRLRSVAAVEIRTDDVGTRNASFVGKFDFIRAANILNKGYFRDDQLRSALGNVLSYLADRGGALLVVRTHGDGTNHGTLFHIDARKRCEVSRRFGGGSEIEDLVQDVARSVTLCDASAACRPPLHEAAQ